MLKRIFLYTILVLTALTLVPTINVVEDIRVSNRLEIGFKTLFDYNVITPELSLQQVSQQVRVECRAR